MKKYRYHASAPGPKRHFLFAAIKLAIAWNCLGFAILCRMRKTKVDEDPEFVTKSWTDQVLTMMGMNRNDMKVVRFTFSWSGIEKTVRPAVDGAHEVNISTDPLQHNSNGNSSTDASQNKPNVDSISKTNSVNSKS